MTVHTGRASSAISASTSSASATVGLGFKFIRIVNPTANICYVTSGAGSATATSANPAVGPTSTAVFEKPEDHDTVAVLLSASTGTIPVCGDGSP